ncbi:hypothetical protein I6N95_00285 [Vagococcus sp. BWB3-3]|uniref:WxL domain-containing protein n=1 Tax=Vagococcus allomyrinae TaxID=2794353 RepID=A0A940STU7_9ENTE|nr:hypothetical protein [Vagococcus allomyrinae]MBP1039431.1 hypothetical protein [Vagococcus allomyrinae]
MKKILTGTLMITLSAGILLAAQEAKAWTGGSEDPIENNSQTIKGQETGEMELKGWFGTFDPTEDPDPELPQPNENGKEWIDVTMPSTVLFGSLATDNGAVYSPNYQITNNSAKGLKVSATQLTSSTPLADLELDMKIQDGNNLGGAMLTVPLITTGGMLSETTEMTQMPKKTTVNFDLVGQFNGSYPTIGNAVAPDYSLEMAFEVLD